MPRIFFASKSMVRQIQYRIGYRFSPIIHGNIVNLSHAYVVPSQNNKNKQPRLHKKAHFT